MAHSTATQFLRSSSPAAPATMALVAGCMSLRPLEPRASTADVRAAWGAPTTQVRLPAGSGGGERWAYSSAPEGRTVQILSFDGTGKLVSNVQGLTPQRVARGHRSDAGRSGSTDRTIVLVAALSVPARGTGTFTASWTAPFQPASMLAMATTAASAAPAAGRKTRGVRIMRPC